MNETSKAMRRRFRDPMFASRYFVGRAIDIGSGNDPLSRQLGYWPLLQSVDEWDVKDGDAQLLNGVANETYDLVYSSHCLEHVRDPGEAMFNWFRVLKHGGHMVVSVPDWEMYEREIWPSRFNPDHKSVFAFQHVAEHLINDDERVHTWDVIKVERIIEGFDPTLPVSVDQTQTGAECAIEFVVRKP
jgi:predicted SAM-dependent methyltransferase